ncbi:MAG: OmpA family protein [Candidatus Abyssobacteria bacterium SURF_17]|uniref:OmpA family protein n=1 Tax=Candidatus Abyssobacteria bacterium SURF_17 TaxID=2093361 RepID=A0A419EW52_9BACT|nr:MAG: OmpA family protein [Candidatus Abyssubacteria bacterium SURF_17]
MKVFKLITIIVVTVLLLVSCADTPKWQTGAAAGGGIGAVTGAVIGHQSGREIEGALIGGAVGAVAGGLIGAQLDKQQAELSQVAEVQRPSEEELVVIMHDQVLFDVNEYTLKPGSEDNLAKVADVIIKYPDFNILVEGHTDSTGSDTYNQWLSEKRAESVASFLVSRGIDGMRVQTIGYGETRPVATNDTPEGRQQNRRVEIHITPRQA